jgi:hypothetical protein
VRIEEVLAMKKQQAEQKKKGKNFYQTRKQLV